MTQPTLVFDYHAPSGLWHATCAVLGGFRAQAITLRRARLRIQRELYQRFPNLEYVEEVRLPEPVAAELRAYQADRDTLDRLEMKLPQQRLSLAQRMIHLQMTITDAARLLRISPQRLALQLGAEVHSDHQTRMAQNESSTQERATCD